MGILEITAIIAFVTVLTVIIWYNKIYKPGLRIPSPYIVAMNTPETQKTPLGASIRSQNKERLSDRTLQVIDEGISENIRRVESLHPEYPWKFTHSDFTVALLDAEISESGVPGFKVPLPKNSPYVNSEYRKGTKENPYLLAAGLMVAVGNPYGNIIAVPKPITEDWQLLKDGTDYECEHIQAAFNDPALFEATEHHTSEGHPIYRESFSFSFRALKSPRKPLFVCRTSETLIGDLDKK